MTTDDSAKINYNTELPYSYQCCKPLFAGKIKSQDVIYSIVVEIPL